MDSRVDGTADSLIPIRPGGGRPPLHCLHAVSGSPYAYNGLTQLLDPDQPVHAFEAPGFDTDSEPVSSLPALAAGYTEALLRSGPGPYYLLGWSMGGVLALDMALRLTAAGHRVPLLVVVDANTPVRQPLPSPRSMARQFLHDLMAAAGIPEDGVDAAFAGLPEDADPADAFARVEAAGVLPEEVDAEFLVERYGLFHAHVSALYDYAPPGRYDGTVLAVKASRSAQDLMRWEGFATDVRDHVLDGDHHTIWQGAALTEMGRVVQAALDAAQAGEGGR